MMLNESASSATGMSAVHPGRGAVFPKRRRPRLATTSNRLKAPVVQSSRSKLYQPSAARLRAPTEEIARLMMTYQKTRSSDGSVAR